jgi:hypothetical protein
MRKQRTKSRSREQRAEADRRSREQRNKRAAGGRKKNE